jgi:WD40 repeat protein
VWDLYSCEVESTLTGHGGDVRHCQWHPASSLLASASKDALVKLWDARTAGEALATLHGHKGAVMQVGQGRAAARRGLRRRGLGTRGGGVVLMQLTGGAPAVLAARLTIPLPHSPIAPCLQAQWNQNGNWLLSVSRDQTLKARPGGAGRTAIVLQGRLDQHSGALLGMDLEPLR